jgi:hypothetical protein
MSAMRLRDRLVEFFTLREAEREIRAIPPETQASLARGLALAFQRREAAETLWPRGSVAEALRFASAGLDLAISVIDVVARTLPSPLPPWVTRAQGTLTDVRARVPPGTLPELDADARPADEEAFRAMIDALTDLQHSRSVKVASTLAQMRRQRAATTATTTLSAVAVLAWWLHVPQISSVIASAELDPAYGADNAIDGDPKKGWYLPDRQTGWLELTLGKPQAVSALRFARVTGNRGTKDARIETFLNGAPVKTIDVTLPEPISGQVLWSDAPIDSPRCDKIRITVKSSYLQGAAIDEVEVE